MSVTTPATLTEVADLYNEAIQTIFVKGSETPNDMEKIFHVEDTKSYLSKDSSISGTERAKFVGDNASVIYDAPVQNFDQTYTQKKYADGLKISHHAWKFGLELRNLTNIVDDLVDSMRVQIEMSAADMLNNSYNTSFADDDGQTVSTAGGDTVAYISASHTREDGGTAWGNRVTDGTTVNMDFEYDALKAARKTSGAILSPRGKQTGFQLDTLVCKYGSSVHDKYEELMGAIARNMIPGGNENDGAAKVGLPKLVTMKYLDNDAYWWAFDSRYKNNKYGLQWRWSERPKLLEPKLEYDSQEYRRQAFMFFDRGANDMRSFVGSKGTNAA